MSYRNDVKIVMSKDNYNTMIERSKKLGDQEACLFSPQNLKIKERSNNTVILSWTWIKWDESLIDVAFVLNFLDQMEDEGYAYSYCRIGEDFTDMEERIYRGPNDDDYSCDCICIIRDFSIEED